MLFTDKIFNGEIDEQIHKQFVRFSIGTFEDRALMKVVKSKDFIKLTASYDLMKDLTKIIGENTEKLVKNLHNREKFNSINFFNIFNQIGGQIYPSFDERLNNLSKITGSNSFLSGSGPSMFSMFEKSEVPSNLKFPIFHTFSLGDEGSIK